MASQVLPDGNEEQGPRTDLMEIRRVPGAGRGLFAKVPIARGTLLERAPCLRYPAANYQAHARHTLVEHYVFSAGRSGDMLMALGWGSLYNHNPRPSVDYKVNAEVVPVGEEPVDENPFGEDTFIEYSAARDIALGEELCIYYGGHVPPEWNGTVEGEEEESDGEFVLPGGGGSGSEDDMCSNAR